MNKIYLLNAILVCVLFFVKEFSIMYRIVITRLPIQTYSYPPSHISTLPIIPAFHKHNTAYEKTIAGPDT